MSVYKVCSDMLSIAVTKNRLGGKGLFSYRLWDITERSQGRNSRQGLGGRTMRKTIYWSAPWPTFSYQSCSSQAHLPRHSTAHSKLSSYIN